MRSELGLVHVYTGEGKGKTTAALGLALRSWGHGLRVCIIQFMKKGDDYGEIKALKRMEGIDVHQFGTGRLVYEGHQTQEDVDLAERALELAKEVLSSEEYDLVILDEVNVATYYGLLDPKKVIDVVRSRHEGVEVVLTGRNAPEVFINEADLVTKMQAKKHPYDKGVGARKGVEY